MTDAQSGADSHSKGARNEREAANILGRVYGRGHVDKVSRYSNNDPLRFIDVIAAKDGWPVRFVQVKTNGFSAEARRKYGSRIETFPESVVCEVWVRVDRKGWKIYRYDRDDGEWDPVLEMDTCDEEETVEAFRELVGYYEKHATGGQPSQDETLDSGDGDDVTVTPRSVQERLDRVAHLYCTRCRDHPSFACLDGDEVLLCHCTHDDGPLDPVHVHSFDDLPEQWEFTRGETGGE